MKRIISVILLLVMLILTTSCGDLEVIRTKLSYDQELLENYTLEEIEEEIIYNSLEFYLKFKPIEIQNKKYVLKETIDKCCKIDKKYHKNIIKTIYSPSKAIRCLILKNKKFYQYLIIDFISIKIE